MTVSVEYAATRLPELLDELPAGPITLTRGGEAVARIVPAEAQEDLDERPCRLGTMKGTVLSMADDFNAPLDEFKDYMP